MTVQGVRDSGGVTAPIGSRGHAQERRGLPAVEAVPATKLPEGPQREAVERNVRLFGCVDDHVIHEHPFDLPERWVLVIMGENKGRLRSFGVSPSGQVAS